MQVKEDRSGAGPTSVLAALPGSLALTSCFHFSLCKWKSRDLPCLYYRMTLRVKWGCWWGFTRLPRVLDCRAVDARLEMGFTALSCPLSPGTRQHPLMHWTCSESGDNEFGEDAEVPPRSECEGALIQWSSGPINVPCETPASDWAIFKVPLSNLTLGVAVCG